MLRRLFKIFCGDTKEFWIIGKFTNALVAMRAKKSTDFSGDVVMIDVELSHNTSASDVCLRLPANSTDAALGSKHGLILRGGDSVRTQAVLPAVRLAFRRMVPLLSPLVRAWLAVGVAILLAVAGTAQNEGVQRECLLAADAAFFGWLFEEIWLRRMLLHWRLHLLVPGHGCCNQRVPISFPSL